MNISTLKFQMIWKCSFNHNLVNLLIFQTGEVKCYNIHLFDYRGNWSRYFLLHYWKFLPELLISLCFFLLISKFYCRNHLCFSFEDAFYLWLYRLSSTFVPSSFTVPHYLCLPRYVLQLWTIPFMAVWISVFLPSLFFFLFVFDK